MAAPNNAIPVMHGTFRYSMRIYYEDTDAGGVVYHANYLRYMGRARSEWLRALGKPVEKIVRDDACLFVVRSLEMKFMRPAQLGDLLEISAGVARLKKASMQIKQSVFCNDKELVSATIELAMVSSETFRPVAIPKHLQLAVSHQSTLN